MKNPRLHESVQECSSAYRDTANSLIEIYKARIREDGTLVFASDISHGEVIGLGKTIAQINRSATFETGRMAGYFWINIAGGKYGDKKNVIMEIFGAEHYEKMYVYFSNCGTICSRWDGQWKEQHSWDWHRREFPEDMKRRKYTHKQTAEVNVPLKVGPGEIALTVHALGDPTRRFKMIVNMKKGIQVLEAPDPATGEVIPIVFPFSDLVMELSVYQQEQKLADLAAFEKRARIPFYRSSRQSSRW